MNIYSSEETNFDRNGYGFLSECISAYVTESLNGDDVLEIEYPLNGPLSEYLTEGNIIKANVGNDNFQLFRIYRSIKTFDTIKIYAPHISYDLKYNMLVNIAPTNLGCQAFGQWILNNTQYSSGFSFYSDITGTGSARYVRKNPLEAIIGKDDNSMVNIFGGELERDNFTLKLLQRRGSDQHTKLIVGKNITQIKSTIDITSLYTKIMPIGYDGLLIPELYVDSPLINDYPSPKIGKVEFRDIIYDPTGEQEGSYTDINDAYQALRDATNKLYTDGIDKPTITIKINWLELSKMEQYKNQYSSLEQIHLGDTITAQLLGIDYTTKVTKTKYNVLNDMIEKFEIGTIQQTITNMITINSKEIQEINPGSILQQAKENATNQINSALGGYIYLDYDIGNLYIMDTDNPTTAQKIWRWNLNGLGYSSTGINGPYDLAMTMDGQIVADFITTGTLNTSVISGYEGLTIQVMQNQTDIFNTTQQLENYATTDVVDDLNDSIEDIQTNTYTKQDIQNIIDGTGVNGVKVTAVVSAEASFDADGLHYSKINAKTSSVINEKGLEVDDDEQNELLFSGYDDDPNSQTYESSVVRTGNLTVKTYLLFANNTGRFEKFKDADLHEGPALFL